MVQRPHHFAVVDEVDSILIDEARTPLIISGPAEESTDLYYEVDRIIPKLKAGAVTREAVRDAATKAGVTYSTVLGDLGFDENGDTTQKIISLYKVENGDWVFDSQIDYAQQ